MIERYVPWLPVTLNTSARVVFRPFVLTLKLWMLRGSIDYAFDKMTQDLHLNRVQRLDHLKALIDQSSLISRSGGLEKVGLLEPKKYAELAQSYVREQLKLDSTTH